MSDRMKLRLAGLALLGCLLGVGLIESPEDHGPMKPGPNAPAYVNWRTGEMVQP